MPRIPSFPRVAAALLSAAVGLQIWASASAVGKPQYVGASRCRACHMTEHQGWLETPHARSLETLAHGDPKAIQAMSSKLKIKLQGSAATTDGCLQCHVTGFRLAGGYPHPDSTKSASLAAVGCESCHGPGSLHVTAPLAEKKKLVTRGGAATCTTCHTKTLSPDFDYAAYVERGVHGMKKAAP